MTLWQDVRFGVRTLAKRPGFALVAVLTLALGIGANTAIFSVVNAVLLRPMPFKDAERLVIVYETTQSVPRDFISVPNLEDYRSGSRSFEGFATFVPQSVNLTGSGAEPERVVGAFVTSSFFPVLGIQPVRGRAFTPEDDAQGGGQVALLAHELWQRRFGADPEIIGRSLTFNGEPYTVVGIMPAGFRYPTIAPDVLLPAQKWPNYKVARSYHGCWVVWRLKAGATREAAQEELRAGARRLEEASPEDNRGRGVEVVGLHEQTVEDVRPALLILLGAVGLILAIACANIANLLLARGAWRVAPAAAQAVPDRDDAAGAGGRGGGAARRAVGRGRAARAQPGRPAQRGEGRHRRARAPLLAGAVGADRRRLRHRARAATVEDRRDERAQGGRARRRGPRARAPAERVRRLAGGAELSAARRRGAAAQQLLPPAQHEPRLQPAEPPDDGVPPAAQPLREGRAAVGLPPRGGRARQPSAGRRVGGRRARPAL